MAYTLSIPLSLPATMTGLTDLRAQVIDSNGGDTAGSAEQSTVFAEVGSGLYAWTGSIPDAHRGFVKFYSNADSTTILAVAAINPEEAEYTDAAISGLGTPAQAGDEMDLVDNLNDNAVAEIQSGLAIDPQDVRDAMKLAPSAGAAAAGSIDAQLAAIAVKTTLIGTATVTFTSPVSDNGQVLELVAGDDYLAADSRALSWSGTTWPDLTAGAVALILRRRSAVPIVLEQAGTVLAADSCQIELTKEQTALLHVGEQYYDFVLRATLADASVVTLVTGLCTVLR